MAKVNGANEKDAESCLEMLKERRIESLSFIWADGAYRRLFLKEDLASLGITLSVVGEVKSGYWIHKDEVQEFKPPAKVFPSSTKKMGSRKNISMA